MKIYRPIILTTLFLFTSLLATAQYLESGTSIINCSTIPKYARRDKTDFINYHTEQDRSNHLPHRFEVAKTDASITGDNNQHVYEMSWTNANNACKNYNDKSGWRLPTQREMSIMFMLRSDLKGVFGFIDLRNIYWTHTLCSIPPNTIWATDWRSNGISRYTDANNSFYVRCVREL